MVEKQHVFEKAGLGIAPFKFIGIEKRVYCPCPGAPALPGSSCDYCGTGIMYCCWLEDAAGKKFKVGTECVRKTGDRGLKKVVSDEKKRLDRENRHQKEQEKMVELTVLLKDTNTVDMLTKLPHPNSYMADQGKTFKDYADFIVKNAGKAGRCRLLAMIKNRTS